MVLSHPSLINIIDTPGHVASLKLRSLDLDDAVGVLTSVEGVQPRLKRCRQMDKYNVPRLGLVAKMDRMSSDFPLSEQ